MWPDWVASATIITVDELVVDRSRSQEFALPLAQDPGASTPSGPSDALETTIAEVPELPEWTELPE